MEHNIIFGYESLADAQSWTLNGRLTPSTIVRTEIEKNSLNLYDNNVYDALICPSHKANNIKDIFPGNKSKRVEKKQISDITTEKYIYCISIHSFHVYVRYTSHISISEQVKSHIRDGQAKLVFYYPNEGHCVLYELLMNKFNKLIIDLNLPKKQIYFVHGDLNEKNYSDCPFQYIPINNFPFWLSSYLIEPKVTYIPSKLFLYYNRCLHLHRIAFTTMMQTEDLLSDCILSFGELNKSRFLHAIQEFKIPNLSENYNKLYTLSNTSPDLPDIKNTNNAISINKDHFANTFVSVVSDTIVKKDICFLSEKVFKPICIGHPFIIISSPFVLAELRKQNYKTFSDFWDESYDLDTDPVSRFKKIIAVLKQIKKYSTTELLEIRKIMTDILDHNRHTFQQFIRPIPGFFGQSGIFKTFKVINDQ